MKLPKQSPWSGWALPSGTSVAHYVMLSRSGQSALSLCGHVWPTQAVDLARDEVPCPDCQILLEHKEATGKVYGMLN